MSDKVDTTVIEISGAGSASLLRVFMEARTDLLLKLDFRVIVNRTVENSDAHTSHSKDTEKFMLDGWTRIDHCDVSKLIEKGDCLGLLRFRRNEEHLSPSFRDRRIMGLMRTRSEKSIFILAISEVTSCLGIKTRMSGFLVGRNMSDANVEIKVPCLGAKSQYIKGQPSSQARASLVDGMGETTLQTDSVIRSFQKISENFHNNVNVVMNEVLELESERNVLERRISQLRNNIQEKKLLMKKTQDYDLDHVTQQFLDEFLSSTGPDLNLNTIYKTETFDESDDESVGGTNNEELVKKEDEATSCHNEKN